MPQDIVTILILYFLNINCDNGDEHDGNGDDVKILKDLIHQSVLYYTYHCSCLMSVWSQVPQVPQDVFSV